MSVNKRVFVVVGPESSGTRMMTRIMVYLGCRGCADHGQPVDGPLNKGKGELARFLADKGDKFVVRRSWPHGGRGPNVEDIVSRFVKAGWVDVRFVITHRNFASMCTSQLRAGHVGSFEVAQANIAKAYRRIFDGVGERPYVIVNYGDMQEWPVATIKYICSYWNLDYSSEAANFVRKGVEHSRMTEYMKSHMV